MGPVTTNPWLIAAINMTIVFGVLAMLGFLMKVIYFVDPTRQKKQLIQYGTGTCRERLFNERSTLRLLFLLLLQLLCRMTVK